MLTKAQAHSRLASPQDRGQRGQAELPRPRTPPKVSSQGFSTLSWGSPTPEEKETGPTALFAGLPAKCPGGGNDNPLQYYCLEHPMDRGVWQATVYGVTKIQARLSTHSFLQQNENMGPLVRKLLRISRQKWQGINQVWTLLSTGPQVTACHTTMRPSQVEVSLPPSPPSHTQPGLDNGWLTFSLHRGASEGKSQVMAQSLANLGFNPWT